MKKISLSIALAFFACSVIAQRSYTEAIQQGDAALAKGEYKTAINKYFAAEAFDLSKKEVVKAKVNAVFDKIEALRREADEAKRQAQSEQNKTKSALAETEAARQHADSLYQKADKLVNAFFFYANRFALAYGEKGEYNQPVFYFIDKNGDPVTKLGQWAHAEQFDWRGYAKVKKEEAGKLINNLLDTLGRSYQVAYDVKDLAPEIQALDLSGQALREIPAAVFNYKGLEVVLLNSNLIKVLPPQLWALKDLTVLDLDRNWLESLPLEIGQLKNLTTLDLSRNGLSSLPPEIGELKSLTSLNLRFCRLNGLPPEIGQLKKLTRLNLSYNQLTSLPPEIGQLHQLKILNLQENQVSAAEQEKIRKLLPGCEIIF